MTYKANSDLYALHSLHEKEVIWHFLLVTDIQSVITFRVNVTSVSLGVLCTSRRPQVLRVYSEPLCSVSCRTTFLRL